MGRMNEAFRKQTERPPLDEETGQTELFGRGVGVPKGATRDRTERAEQEKEMRKRQQAAVEKQLEELNTEEDDQTTTAEWPRKNMPTRPPRRKHGVTTMPCPEPGYNARVDIGYEDR